MRSGGVWTQQAQLVGSDGVQSGGYFGGGNVAISGDIAVVGAPFRYDGSGAVYVFGRTGGVWSQTAELRAPRPTPFDGFGSALAMSGGTLVVGAWGTARESGAAYVFRQEESSWVQEAKLTGPDEKSGDAFGGSVSISGDTVIVGAFYANSFSGAAYIFSRISGVWTEEAALSSPISTAYYYGASVAVSGDTAVVSNSPYFYSDGTSVEGAAYIYQRSDTGWIQREQIEPLGQMTGLGTSVSINRNTILAGDPFINDAPGGGQVGVLVGHP